MLAIYEDKSPNNCIDLKALVIQLLNEIQAKIKGNETDTYKVFYKTLGDTPTPQDENYCRDRLTDLLELMLTKYQFECVTERDMPNVKRADIVCQNSHLKLPIEIKGQWHKDLYISLNDQLGDYYLKKNFNLKDREYTLYSGLAIILIRLCVSYLIANANLKLLLSSRHYLKI